MTFDNLIGGRWTPGKTTTENRNPSDPADLIGLYAGGDSDDLAAAAEAAHAASAAWAQATPQSRADLLDRVAGAITARDAELADMLAREEGKVLAEALGEVRRAAHVFRFFAGEALRLAGFAVSSVRAGVDVAVTRDPLGVVGLITPWNFPIAIPAWKIAPALAYGNTVILKPADLTPGCAWLLAQIIHDAGCPAGVFNLVMGPGSVIGPAMVADPRIAGISFTGSVPVGQGLAAACAGQMKKVQLEMGGKNPMIVMDDADLDLAVNASLNGAFFSAGQRCTASSRLIVQDGIHDRFVAALTDAMQAMRIGDAREDGVTLGPVSSARQLKSNIDYIALAADEGCDVRGGQALDIRGGHFQQPALFVDATNDMRSAREEIFGPCASVIRFRDFEEAVSIANDTPFGLSSGICTTSLYHATAFKRRSAAGMVMVNLPTAGVDYHVPFGGRKESSLGPREQGAAAAEFYTAIKTAYTFAG